MFNNPFKGVFKRYLILLLITMVALSGFFYGLLDGEENPITDKIKSEIVNNKGQ